MAITKLEVWKTLKAAVTGRMTEAEVDEFCGGLSAEDVQQYRRLSAELMAESNKAADRFVEDKEYRFSESGLLEVPLHDWTPDHARTYLDLIDGSEFEQLHFTALLSIPNAGLLWDVVKPVAE